MAGRLIASVGRQNGSHMNHLHWQYLETLDIDLDTASRYVDFTEENYQTYSIEFVRLLLAVCSEIDVVAKILCTKINENSQGNNINEYRATITAEYPKLHTLEIEIPKHQIILNPWSKWGEDEGNPSWWRSYNQVKHKRDREYKEANLINTLNALAGLYVLLFYLDKKVPPLRLMRINSRYDGGSSFVSTHYWRTPDEMDS